MDYTPSSLPSEYLHAVDNNPTSFSTVRFTGNAAPLETTHELSVPQRSINVPAQEIMWEPHLFRRPGWHGNVFTGDFRDPRSSNLLGDYTDGTAGSISTDKNATSVDLPSASQMSSSRSDPIGLTASSVTSRETPRRRPDSVRACDYCHRAKARCDGQRPGSNCQRPSNGSRPRSARACDSCRKAKNRCTGQGPGGNCPQPLTGTGTYNTGDSTLT